MEFIYEESDSLHYSSLSNASSSDSNLDLEVSDNQEHGLFLINFLIKIHLGINTAIDNFQFCSLYGVFTFLVVHAIFLYFCKNVYFTAGRI